MNKLQMYSRFFKKLFLLILIGWPIFLLLVWFTNQHSFVSSLGINIRTFTNAPPILVPIAFSTKVYGYLASLIPAGLNMLIAYFFVQLFSYYEKGNVFTQSSIDLIKKIGMTMIVWAILNPVYQLLISYILTVHNPHGYRVMTLSIGSYYFRNLITAGLVFLVGYLMQEAFKLYKEQLLTV